MLFLYNKITSRTPGKAGNTGHGPEYHKPPPVDVPHKYRARQAASGQGGGRMPDEARMQRESTRRQGRGNEVGPGEGAPARMAVCDTAGRKAAGGGDESAARVDASCEQPVKPTLSDFTPPPGDRGREWNRKTSSCTSRKGHSHVIDPSQSRQRTGAVRNLHVQDVQKAIYIRSL